MAKSFTGALRCGFSFCMAAAAIGEAFAACEAAAPFRDWAAGASATSMPVRPAHCAQLDQTPPDFSWPAAGRSANYLFELRRPDGVVEKRTVRRNWALWGEALAAGTYAWRVSVSNPKGGEETVGAWREFVIQSGAQAFVVPDVSTLTERATTRARPRAFYAGEPLQRLHDSLKDERRAVWEALVGDLSVPAKPAQGLEAPVWMARAQGQKAYSRALGDAKREAGRDLDQMLAAAFAYRVTGGPAYKQMALAKLAEVTRWPAHGATGASHHQVAGRFAWMLALAYDWLHADLSESERRAVRDAIAARVEPLLDVFGIAEGRMDRMPYNSHGWVALGEIAATASLLVGDDPRATTWFEETIHRFIQSISPWAGPEGGMANGTAYGIWDLTALLIPMDVIGHALDVNLYEKSPLRNMTRFLMAFIPPGSPVGVFGDAAERQAGLWVGDFVRAYALRAPSPEADWYAEQWASRRHLLAHLFAPAEGGAPNGREAPQGAHGMWAKTSGWVAMHSDIGDPQRTSVYFKSSPFGSFNHSHADQNAFTVVSGGRAVLIDSGYYDYYRSPHWRTWYTQTRAHNAITFDGGRGQKAGDRAAAGHVISFEQHGDYDVAVGDAARSYDGAVNSMRRTLIFMRPDRLLVVDRAASSVPRKWEWNLHALSPFSETGPASIAIGYGAGQACVTVYSPQSLAFRQEQGFPVPPDPKWGAERPAEAQWHGQFIGHVPERELTVVALVETSCRSPTAMQVVAEGQGLSIGVDRYRFSIAADGSVIRMP